ncbi:MAG: hypothetical protein J0I82_29775 [Spirosoma sp.]|nr:hypothetical protein [Spirosoma sp.]OJW75156.1 MAG: hypothetical protein BGO59_17820 [Spirosoma sp. 48-14]
MVLITSVSRRLRTPLFLSISLFITVLTFAQVNLAYRLLNGYTLSSEASVNKNKPTVFVLSETEAFEKVFNPAVTTKRPDAINFTKEAAIGIVLPPTTKPPKLSISKVFVQDSVLTVRYIRLADTTLTQHPQLIATQPLLLVAVPKHNFLKTKLVENGKVVQILKKPEED